ncbi:hypothetical protein KBB89_01440 [Candidatus Gracilibacteria bacterium]|nr:hypothetical protein [Candidatus Gracilibacteria bacterium]
MTNRVIGQVQYIVNINNMDNIIMVSGTAQDSLDVALESLSDEIPVSDLVDQHNEKYWGEWKRILKIGETQSVVEITRGIVDGYVNFDFKDSGDVTKLVQEVRKRIQVKDFPLEILTTKLDCLGLKSTTVNPLMKKISYAFELILFEGDEVEIERMRGLGKVSTSEIKSFLDKHNLWFYGYKGGRHFLKRDFRFQDFYKKVSGEDF